MKTIHRFILKSYLGPMVLTFFIVMFVFMMQFMWRYVEDLVGKGLEVSVIAEFMFYAAISTMPMALPLATLLAAIMAMGNLGEHYELLAMKSAGMSLMRITRPLVVLVFFVCIASFFMANNLVPYAYRKTMALIYDITQKKQDIEFKDGIFFNGIDNMSIRVERQNPETKLLRGMLIYDNSDPSNIMNTILADSGYIRLSDDKKYLFVTLFHGQNFENNRNYRWYDQNDMQRRVFERQDMTIPMAGFDFSRTDTELFSSGSTKNIVQLEEGIDSLTRITDESNMRTYGPMLRGFVFPRDTLLMRPVTDSLRKTDPHVNRVVILDSIALLDVRAKKTVWNDARTYANNSRGLFTFDEDTAKEALTQLYRHQAAWHEKISLPVSIMIFFLIGASLGAIIRKGGLGMPVVVSVVFFVIYYIISITGKKLVQEGTWSAVAGMWLSTFILAPLAAFLSYKANNDSNLFNFDWYILKLQQFRNYIQRNVKARFVK